MGDEKNSEKDFEKEKKKKIEKEPEKQTKKAPKPKKRKKKGKAGFLFILLILLAVIGAGVYLLIPSKNRVSHNQYFGLEDDNQYGLIVNSEIVDITNGAPFEENGVWYLPFSTLYYEISDAFYYDGLALLYTDPLQTYSAAPGESFYTDSDGIKYTLTYQPCYFKDGSLCIALDYLKLMDYSYYTVDDTMKSIWVFNDWSEQPRASLLKDTKARTQAGIKNDIVASLATDDVVTVLEQGASWSRVQTQTGLVGYVQNKMLGEIKEEAKAVPDGRPLPKYTNIAMDEMVVMGWHQVFSESGYSQLDDIISTAKGMNVICPTWFTIKDNDGNIQNLGEKKYVTKAHKAGLQVWVMLDDINISTDGLQVFGTTSHRKTLITAVIDAVKELGADGINLDVETIKSDVGPSYIQFIRELSAACRKEKLVLSVDNYSPMPHTAFYDRTQQGQVVDYVVVMAYDEHYVKGPEAGSDNHVGILCGKTDAGDWIAVHCSSGKNGVTVGEAYSASFRYIRQPSFYPTQEQVQEMQSSSTVSTTTGDAAASTGTDIFSANVTVSNTLQDAMKSNTSDSTGFTTLESTEKTSILPDKIDLSKEKVAVFKAK